MNRQELLDAAQVGFLIWVDWEDVEGHIAADQLVEEGLLEHRGEQGEQTAYQIAESSPLVAAWDADAETRTRAELLRQAQRNPVIEVPRYSVIDEIATALMREGLLLYTGRTADLGRSQFKLAPATGSEWLIERGLRACAREWLDSGYRIGVAVLLENGDLRGAFYQREGWAFKWANRQFKHNHAVRGFINTPDGNYWRFTPEQGWEG